jgi:hypothetical protein
MTLLRIVCLPNTFTPSSFFEDDTDRESLLDLSESTEELLESECEPVLLGFAKASEMSCT